MSKNFSISIPDVDGGFDFKHKGGLSTNKGSSYKQQAEKRIESNEQDYFEDSCSAQDEHDRTQVPYPRRMSKEKQQPYPVVQFQQFNVQRKSGASASGKGRSFLVHKKFEIEVPDVKFDQDSFHQYKQHYPEMKEAKEIHNKFAVDKIKPRNTHTDVLKDQFVLRQPPAPSKGSTKGKVFVFPAGAASQLQQDPVNAYQRTSVNNQVVTNSRKREPQISQAKTQGVYPESRTETVACEDHIKLISSLRTQLEKTRQELMIKDSQIELLQKIITESFAMCNNNNNYNTSTFPVSLTHTPYAPEGSQARLGRTSPKSHHTTLRENSSSSTIFDTERILLEKDKNIQELTERLERVSGQLKAKNQELAQCKYENSKLQGLLESQQHAAFLAEKRAGNQKLTQTFYEAKKDKKRSTTGNWEEVKLPKNPYDIINKYNIKTGTLNFQHKQVNQNKWQHPEHSPSRKDWHIQTSKNKSKAVFDFKTTNNNKLDISEYRKKK